MYETYPPSLIPFISHNTELCTIKISPSFQPSVPQDTISLPRISRAFFSMKKKKPFGQQWNKSYNNRRLCYFQKRTEKPCLHGLPCAHQTHY